MENGKLSSFLFNFFFRQFTCGASLRTAHDCGRSTPYSCGAQNSLRLGAPMNFDRCAIVTSFHLALRALRRRSLKEEGFFAPALRKFPSYSSAASVTSSEASSASSCFSTATTETIFSFSLTFITRTPFAPLATVLI